MFSLVIFLLGLGSVYAYNNGPQYRLPPAGVSSWCIDDLCGLLDLCYADQIEDVADAMISSGMAKLWTGGVRPTWLVDDCFQSPELYNGTGKPYADPSRFPNGMAPVSDHLHAKGIDIILYTSIGTKTCKGDRPASFGREQLWAETYLHDMHADGIKCDNCNRPSGHSDRDLFLNFSRVINATGERIGKYPGFFLCEWGDEEPWLGWGGEAGQQYRVAGDHIPVWTLQLARAIEMGLQRAGLDTTPLTRGGASTQGPLSRLAARSARAHMAVAGLAAQVGRGDAQLGAQLAAALGLPEEELRRRAALVHGARLGVGAAGHAADVSALGALVQGLSLAQMEDAAGLAGPAVLPTVDAFLYQDAELRRGSGNKRGLAHAIGSTTRSWAVPSSSSSLSEGTGGLGTTFGKGTGDIIEFMPNVTGYNKRYSYTDPDYLETMLWFLTDYHDSVAEMTFWSLWGGPMIMATDPRNMTAQKQSIVLNEDALAVARDEALLLPALQFRDPAKGTEAWSRPMGNGDFAVVLFNSNFGGNSTSVSLPLQDIKGWPSGVASATGKDLWAHSSVGTVHSEWTASLPSHGVSYVRLTPAKEK